MITPLLTELAHDKMTRTIEQALAPGPAKTTRRLGVSRWIRSLSLGRPMSLPTRRSSRRTITVGDPAYRG